MTNIPPWVPEWAENQSDEAYELADQIEPILRGRARGPKPTNRYAELSRRVGRFHRDPTFLTALGVLSYQTLMREGYALSALVVNESGKPGRSFYGLVSDIKDPDEDKQWEPFLEQYNRITRMRR
jgi:hypothetical protein